jgi:Aminoglycoside-2''-adenylyltransferase
LRSLSSAGATSSQLAPSRSRCAASSIAATTFTSWESGRHAPQVKLLGVVAGMTLEDVVEVLTALDAGGIDYWVEGGWGIDALLGRQTREHRDLDLGVGLDEVARIETLLPQFRHSSPGRVAYSSRMSAAVSSTCCSSNAAKAASFGSSLREGGDCLTRRGNPRIGIHRRSQGPVRERRPPA